VYTLRAESGNSLKYEYGSRQAGQRGTPIVVTRGAHLKDLTLFPPKLGAICGRVTDAAGTPRSALRIFVETFENGQLVDKSCGNIYLGHESEATQTDSTGRFRADKLPPGEYFFAFPYGYFSTFFSSDGSLSAATPLQLPVGKDLGCGAESPIELRVPAVINQGHTIAGQVVGDLPRSVGTAFGCPSRGTCAALEATRGQQLRNWTTLTSSTLITCRTDDSCSNFTARTVQNQ